jgi:hypothetical protein
VALAAAAVPSAAAASPQAPAPLLDVPYLSQSEALCGAAAMAMVMRYWGVRGVYAETFAELVDPEARGIRGSAIVRTLEERGFDAASFEGNEALVRSALERRQPLIALIEDSPGRFHYVVIVGWRGDAIVLHDPARSPFRLVSTDAFRRAWSVSGFWTLAAKPRAASAAAPAAAAEEVDAGGGSANRGLCAGMVDEGIRLAGAGDLPGAQRILELASSDCPDDAAAPRELAGVYALRENWEEAGRYARAALARNGADSHASRILATSLFLTDRRDRALDAWNRIGVPTIDLIQIDGLDRTRFAVAEAALGLQRQALLTRGQLARAGRRLDALPSVVASRVTYVPGEDDLATVSASVVERPLLPAGLVPLGALALRAATDRELPIALTSPSGGGEVWSVGWRWWTGRPRLAVALAAPSPFGGTWTIEASNERQTYGTAAAAEIERRRTVALTLSDWLTGATRVQAGVSIDRWSAATTASLTTGVAHEIGGGFRCTIDTGLIAGGFRTGWAQTGLDWRSSDRPFGTAWLARGGFATAGASAPMALWPGAGAGHGRDLLLRAHPLLHDGAIRGVFGRRLLHGGVEWRYWRPPVFRVVRVAPAVFVDAARAFRVPAFGDPRGHVDAGFGLRIAVPGAGIVRADLARGLRDGRTAVSLGWSR